MQALLSEQVEPFGFAGFEHWPFAGSHVPASWHWSEAAQTTGFVPAQVPDWQESDWVQPFPSEQAEPFGFGGFEH